MVVLDIAILAFVIATSTVVGDFVAWKILTESNRKHLTSVKDLILNCGLGFFLFLLYFFFFGKISQILLGVNYSQDSITLGVLFALTFQFSAFRIGRRKALDE